MPHERQQIRDAVVAQLTGQTAAGSRVVKSRFAPARVAQLPMISVYTDGETVDEESKTTAPRELKRLVQVAIDAWVTAVEDVDDALDDIALEIEEAMDSADDLPEAVYDCVLGSTEIAIKLEGDRPLACVHLVYLVEYITDLRVAEIEDVLERAEIRYNLEGAQAEDDEHQDSLTDLHADEDPPLPEEDP